MSDYTDEPTMSDQDAIYAALFPEDVKEAPTKVVEAPQQEELEVEYTEDTGVDENQPTSEEDNGQSEVNENFPIEPPTSWNKEAKENWSKLPPDLQKYLSEKESESQKTINQRFNEAAEARKAAEAERQAIAQEKIRLGQSAVTAETVIQAQLEEKYKNVNWGELNAYDPVKFLQLSYEYNQDKMKLEAVVAQRTQAEQAQFEYAKQKENEYLLSQKALISKYIPEAKDDESTKSIANSVGKYLTQESEYKFTNEELQGLRDARTFAIAHKAMLWDKAQKEAATKRSTVPTKVQTPGNTNTDGPTQESNDLKTLKSKAFKSGKTADIQAYLEKIL